MSSPAVQLPNPTTPMAFFPPELAFQITVSIYSLVGSLSALIWDIFINLHADLKILKTKGISLSIVAYFISRLACLAFLLGGTIVLTYPVRNCDNYRAIRVFFPIGISASCLLFFFRIRAMYAGNNWVIGAFFFLWLAATAGTVTEVLGIVATKIGDTDYCTISRLEHYVVAAAILPAAYDTLAFLAMSWRLVQNSLIEPNMTDRVGTMIFGHHLPAFSRSLLQDGQAYYLTTIVLSVTTSFLFFLDSIPITYRSIISIPNVVLVNNMACHVYRKTRLGVYREFPPATVSLVIPSAILFDRTAATASNKSENFPQAESATDKDRSGIEAWHKRDTSQDSELWEAGSSNKASAVV